jgi:ribonuclease-3
MAVRDPLGPPHDADTVTHRPRADTALEQAEATLGHRFARPALLEEALTHRSALRTDAGLRSNERLEFVGDRVLGLVVAEWLAERFPDEEEGALGRRLAALVAQPTLAEIATSVGLPSLLSVAPGEARAGVKRQATVLADAIEALIGAIYFDGGLQPVRLFIRRLWARAMEAQLAPPKDPKTALQEWAQARGLDLPQYEVAARSGPAHAPSFVISVTVAGQTGTGEAGAKRAAEQIAAADLLARLAGS